MINWNLKIQPSSEERKAQRKERKKLIAEMRAQNEARWLVESQIRQAEIARQRQEHIAREEERLRPKTYRIINRGLIDVPIWESHYRGRNWAAIIEVEPLLPGGVKRSWFNRGSGISKYIVPEQLLVGHVVEFGADYITGVGSRREDRFFGVVLSLTTTELILKPYDQLIDTFAK